MCIRDSTYTLSGKVSDTNGNALAGVLVAGVINGESSTTTTNSAGDYAFSNILPNSSYSVTPTQSNRIFSPASKAGTISVNTSANFSGIVATYTLSGRVVFSNGVGVKGANIVFGSSATESAADGSYSFSGMASGATISLTVSKSGYTFLSATQSISMTSDKTVNLTVSSVANFTVSGTVRNSKKAFLAGTIVIITGVDNQARSAITDRRGTYTVKNVPLGSAAVAIVAAGHQSFSSTLKVVSNTKIANFSLELQNFTVRGSVRTKNGEKVAGLTIRVSGVASAPLVTDSEGAFAIQVSRGTRITLSAAKKRCSFKPGTLRATVLGQDLALAPIVVSCK